MARCPRMVTIIEASCLNIDGGTGLLVPKNDASAPARVLVEMLENDSRVDGPRGAKAT